MYRVGAIVCKSGGTYYFTMQVGKVPSASPGQQLVFSMDETVRSSQELFQKAREEANRRGIGQIVNLPG